MNKSVKFKILQKDKKSKARVGKLITSHGIVNTPVFVTVGTQASVKSLDPRDLAEIGVEIILANTYHLHLLPGEDLIKKFGGLTKFMGWNGVTMTDSGGFQVFSLGINLEHGMVKFLKEDDEEARVRPRLNKITEEGVTFQSHIDGASHKLTPESSIDIQEKLGADLIVAFDDLESPKYSYEETKKSLDLTEKWLLRSKNAHKRPDQLLYGVTHGGRFSDLRIASARFNDKLFDAIALGGAHTDKKNMYEVVDWTVNNVSYEKPKHMLGVGEIDDIFEIVERGIDTFDCVIPTRVARMGWYFVTPPEGNPKNRFRKDIAKSINAQSQKPLSEVCTCYVCQTFTRAYIHHLFRARELLSYRLLSYHNVYLFTNLMIQIRNAIQEKEFLKLKENWLA